MRPRDLKYNKVQRGTQVCCSEDHKSYDLEFGVFGLKSCLGSRIRNKELETVRRVLRKGMRKRGRIRIRVFPAKGLTSKGIGVRMGKGKGGVNKWVADAGIGRTLSEIMGLKGRDSWGVLEGGRKRLPVGGAIFKYEI